MRRSNWIWRSARAGREFALGVATSGRGLPRTLNGLAVRVDAATRRRFADDYERPVAAFLRQHVQPGSEVWNVGANVGSYVLQLGQWVGPEGRVLAFEPNHRAADGLTENVRLNGLADRVELVRSAVAETSGTATLYASGVDGMSRIGRPNPVLESPNAISVPVTTLDEVAAQRQRVPSWIVMDIEGWEIAALKSARALLRHSQFVIELHPSAWQWSGHSRTDLEELLREFGLQAVPLTGQVDPYEEDGHVYIGRASGG